MPQNETKPTITVLYDAQETSIRDDARQTGDVARRRDRAYRSAGNAPSHSRPERDLNDHYRTIESRAEFRQKIERSEFLGIALPASAEDDFFADLNAISKHHFDATHHCWAFRLFHDSRARSSDAGEPSGTAGRPILAAIEGADLFDAAVVVVRWFGGVKLGTGGLSRAYRDTAAETLKQTKIVDRYVYDRFQVRVPFDRMSDAYRLVDPPAVLLAGERFAETNTFEFDVRRSKRDEFTRKLAALRLTLL
jgi:uncharacterized YigZ family protein